MKKALLLTSLFLTVIFSTHCQELSASLGTPSYFIEGLTGVNNVFYIENQDAPAGSESADFYITDYSYSVTYAMGSDYDYSDGGFNYTFDMGVSIPPNALVWAEFYDIDGNFIGYSLDYYLNIIPKPQWLITGSFSGVNVDENNSTISFSGIYPIYSSDNTIPGNIKGLGNRPLNIAGELRFDASYIYTDNSILPTLDQAYLNINLNLLGQSSYSNYNNDLPLSLSECSIGNDFNLVVDAYEDYQTPELSLKTPKITFPIGFSSISLDAGVSLYATLEGHIVIGQDASGNSGFIEAANGERTEIKAVGSGTGFIRGQVNLLGGIGRATAALYAKASLGAGFSYVNQPLEEISPIFGGNIKVWGKVCVKDRWGFFGACYNSNNWYEGAFGDTTGMGKSIYNEDSLYDIKSITFQDTGTMVIPEYMPQPSFSTSGDKLYNVWLETLGSDTYLLFSRLNSTGSAFSQPLVVTNNNNSISDPKIGILPSGSAIITWSQNRYNSVNVPINAPDEDIFAAQDIHFAIYDITSNSIIFTSFMDDDMTAMQSGRAEGRARITVGNNNDALITWVVNNPFTLSSEIWYAHLTESPTSYYVSAPDILSDSPGVNENVQVVYTDDDQALCVWTNNPDGDEETYDSEIAFAEWDGSIWSPTYFLSQNDGTTKLNEMDIASNDGYIAFTWTSSHFNNNNEFDNRLDMLIYDVLTGEWDMNNSFSEIDASYYFQQPKVSISDVGKAIVCFQSIDMYADTLSLSNGELFLYVNDLSSAANFWEEITENTFLCDTSTFIWELTTGFAADNRYYILTQEYNDNGVVIDPYNGVTFGDSELSMVLRGLQVNSDNSISDIDEPEEVVSGLRDNNEVLDFKFIKSYPNPFRDQTTIEFTLRKHGTVNMEIYDVLGNHITTLISNQSMSPGIYKTLFQPGVLASGSYLCNLSLNGRTVTQKLFVE